MNVKIDKGGLQLKKRLRSASAPTPKILSADIEGSKLLIKCHYAWHPDKPFNIDVYKLGINWERIQSKRRTSEKILNRRNLEKFIVTVPSCIPGRYKIGVVEVRGTSKLSYESVIVQN